MTLDAYLDDYLDRRTRSRSLGPHIRAIRQQKRMSLERLAELAELSITYCGEVERGKKEPSLRTLLKIARGLNVPIRTLIAPLDPESSRRVSRDELLQRMHGVLRASYTELNAEALLRVIESHG